jgi:hypothetical protein
MLAHPHKADKERSEMISAGADKIGLGETGDSVFEKLGPPDDISVITRPFGPATGWAWEYHIRKNYRHAPDNGDKVLMIIFDSQGRVKFIKPADVYSL